MPQGAVRPKAAGGHRQGHEGHQHRGGLAPLGDPLSQRVRRVHTRLALLQRVQLPRLLEPSQGQRQTTQVLSSPVTSPSEEGQRSAQNVENHSFHHQGLCNTLSEKHSGGQVRIVGPVDKWGN